MALLVFWPTLLLSTLKQFKTILMKFSRYGKMINSPEVTLVIAYLPSKLALQWHKLVGLGYMWGYGHIHKDIIKFCFMMRSAMIKWPHWFFEPSYRPDV